MNIILIGMRGSGKSSVGKSLAERLFRPFIDMDDQLVNIFGISILEYVSKNGWDMFRCAETVLVKEIAKSDHAVIATGGGVVENEENIVHFKKKGFIIYLQAHLKLLYKRIGEDVERPLLSDSGSMLPDLKNMFKKRKKAYLSAADWVVETDSKNIEEISLEIIDILKNHD